MTIKVIIVEDQRVNLIQLKEHLSRDFPEMEIVAECATVLEATEKINLLRPDLVFLDIELDAKDGGFQVLNHTSSVNYEVIITTSHAQYSTFKFCALDLLLRPFDVNDLKEAVTQYKEKTEKGSGKNIEAFVHNSRHTDLWFHKVGIPVLKGMDFLTIAEIIMCKSENNCTDFYMTNKKKIKATKTLKWVETLLAVSKDYFFRIHDSYIINLNHIIKYKRSGEGGEVVLTNGEVAYVSRRRKEAFLKALADRRMLPPE